jgi:hypothetical protein
MRTLLIVLLIVLGYTARADDSRPARVLQVSATPIATWWGDNAPCRFELSVVTKKNAESTTILCVGADGGRKVADGVTVDDFVEWAIQFVDIYRRDIERFYRAQDDRDRLRAILSRAQRTVAKLRAACGEKCQAVK